MGKARDLKKKKRGEGVKAKRGNKNFEEEEEDLDVILQAYLKQAPTNQFPQTLSPSLRPTPRSGASLVCMNDRFFYFGGECFRKEDASIWYFKELYQFKIAKGEVEWKVAVGEGPGPRSAHQMAVAPFHPTQALLFGGEYGTKKDTKFLQYRDLWLLCTTPSLMWQKVEATQGPGPRSGHRMIGWRNYVVLFGGYVDSGRGELKYLNDLWLFDMRTLTWKSVAKSGTVWPTPRSGFCLCVLGDVLYVVGGYQSQVLNDAYTLEMNVTEDGVEGVKWSKLRNVPAFNRSGMSSVSMGTQAVLFGGITDDVVTDDRIHGQCLKDAFELSSNSTFHPVQQLPGVEVGRYNASMCRAGTSSAYVICGGIVEMVDEELALDDVILVNNSKRECKVLQPLSFTLPEPMSVSDDDYNEGSDDSSSEDMTDDSGSEYDSDDDSDSSTKDNSDDTEGTHPVVKRGQTLREYFQEHMNYWLSINTDLDEAEKERRRLAFDACKSYFDSLSLNASDDD